MGYRYALLNATLPSQAVNGQVVTFNLTFINSGFAATFSLRPVHLIAVKADVTCTAELPTDVADPRFWLPQANATGGGPTYAVSAAVQTAGVETMPEGVYSLFLHLPDSSASLRHRADYAIRLANSAMFNQTTGWNALQGVMAVKAARTADATPTSDSYDAVFECESTSPLAGVSTL